MKRIRIINHFLILSDFLILLLFLFLLKESMYLKWYLLELFHINIRLKIILNAEWPAKFIRLLLLDKQKKYFWNQPKNVGCRLVAFHLQQKSFSAVRFTWFLQGLEKQVGAWCELCSLVSNYFSPQHHPSLFFLTHYSKDPCEDLMPSLSFHFQNLFFGTADKLILDH